MKNLILTLVFAITSLVSFSQISQGCDNYKYTVSTTIDTLVIDSTWINNSGITSFATYSYNKYTVYILDTASIVHINLFDLSANDSVKIQQVRLSDIQTFNNNFQDWDTLIENTNPISYGVEFNINHASLTNVDTVYVKASSIGTSTVVSNGVVNTFFKIVKVTQVQWDSIQNAEATAGVNDIELTTTRLSAYPNPASSNITIDFDVTTNEVPVEIFSMSGQLVYSNDDNRNNGTNSLNVDVSGFQTGIYIVKAGSQTFKFVKQ